MDFNLNDEQKMLRDAVRELLSPNAAVETRNEITAAEPGWSREVWTGMAEMGLLGMAFDDADGEAAAGPVETMVVMSEIGRHLAPEPYLDCVLTPGWLLTAVRAEQAGELVAGLGDGSRLIAFAHSEPGTRWPSAELATTATESGGWTVTGTKNPVGHGDCADSLIVSAKTADGVGLFLVDAAEVSRTGYTTHDGLRGAEVTFDGAAASRLGSGDATPAISETLVRVQTALCAEAVGAMETALDLTTDYLRQRKQFGVPLSTFQALTHRAADMYVSIELSQSMALYATMALAEGVVDQALASRAKAFVGSRSRSVGEEAIQLHGGIGMTAEYLVGHIVARLFQIEATLGSSADHLRELSRGVRDYDMVTVG